MNRRFVFRLLCAVGVAGIALAAWWFSRPQEPAYQGKSLSVWLRNYDYEQPPTNAEAVLKETDEGIRHIGTNAIPFLLAMLDETDPKIKVALNQLAASRSPIHLSLGSAQSDQMKAMAAFRALGPIAKPAIPALADRLASGNGMAAILLADVGLDAIPSLTNALVNTNPPVRMVVIQALGTYATRLNGRANVTIDPKDLGQFRAAATLIIPALISCLHDPNEEVRQTAYATLTFFNQAPDISTPLLVELMSDKDPKVRWFATGALCSSASAAKAATPALLRALHDPDKEVKRNSLLALAYIGAEDTNVRPAVLEFLHGPDAEFRATTAQYLGFPQSFGRAAFADLAQALHDPDRYVRKEAALTLSKFGSVDTPTILPALVSNLGDQYSEPRAAAATALGRQGEAASNAVPALLKLLNDEVPTVRVAAADALVRITPDNPAGLDALVKALCAPDINGSAESACEALVDLGPRAKSAIPDLVKIIQSYDPPPVRLMAVRVLLRVDRENPDGLPVLYKKLQDNDPAIRLEAVMFIGSLSEYVGEPGRKALENAQKDPDKDVREAAAAALNALARDPIQ